MVSASVVVSSTLAVEFERLTSVVGWLSWLTWLASDSFSSVAFGISDVGVGVGVVVVVSVAVAVVSGVCTCVCACACVCDKDDIRSRTCPLRSKESRKPSPA